MSAGRPAAQGRGPGGVGRSGAWAGPGGWLGRTGRVGRVGWVGRAGRVGSKTARETSRGGRRHDRDDAGAGRRGDRCRAPAGSEDVVVRSVEFDTRRIRPGALFVALRGDRVDGHDFAGAAAAAGAVAVLGSGPILCPSPSIFPCCGSTTVRTTPPCWTRSRRWPGLGHRVGRRPRPAGDRGHRLVRQDVHQGPDRRRPARRGRRPRAGGRAAGVVQQRARPSRTPRCAPTRAPDSWCWSCPPAASATSRVLAGVAPPRIGAVLNVGSAHIGEFGSVDAIAKAKSELVQALPSAGGRWGGHPERRRSAGRRDGRR